MVTGKGVPTQTRPAGPPGRPRVLLATPGLLRLLALPTLLAGLGLLPACGHTPPPTPDETPTVVVRSDDEEGDDAPPAAPSAEGNGSNGDDSRLPAGAILNADDEVIITGGSSEDRPDYLPEIGAREGQVTLFYRLRHLQGSQVVPVINLWKSPEGRVESFPALNMLLITDTPTHISQIQEVLARLDTVLPQVEIEARVIEVLHSNEFEYGWDLSVDRTPITKGGFHGMDGTFNTQSFLESLVTGAPFQGAAFEFVTVGHLFDELGDMDLIIRALERQGYADILSNPRILVQSGEEALIKAITREPIREAVINRNATNITVRFEEVGVTLRVTPQVIGTDGIRMEIHPEVSAVQGTRQAGAESTPVPVIAQREVSTVVDARDGETIVIGGLYERRLFRDETMVPVLGSLPLIGHVFRSQVERQNLTEIVFILKVDILGDSSEREGRLLDPRNRPGGGSGGGDGR